MTAAGDAGPGVQPIDITASLAAAVLADPARPLLTFYDDGTGERLELSVATTANWVAKAANLLVDELEVEPGEPVGLDVPPHWHAAVLRLAVLTVGAQVAPLGATGLRVAAWAEGTPRPDADELLGLSLRPMNGGLTRAYPGVVDVATETLGHGDRFVPRGPATTVNARPLAERLMTTDLELLPAVLAGGGSLVLVRRPETATLGTRATTELVSATAGCDAPGVPRIG